VRTNKKRTERKKKKRAGKGEVEVEEEKGGGKGEVEEDAWDEGEDASEEQGRGEKEVLG